LGTQIYHLARGMDDRPVIPEQQAQSIGHELTFSADIEDFTFLRRQLATLSEKVGWRLREQNLQAKTVSIKVRFHDFRTITRSHTLPHTFNDDDTIFQQALHLLEGVKLEPVRLIGVTVSNFSQGTQLSLFSTLDESTSQVNEVMDGINRRFAPGTITKGRTLPPKSE
ncbi:MAG: DNA polymerase IV, partial [Firmicutes bacterium]|nr:DNA polymerase IV [Bacillota bacterium]